MKVISLDRKIGHLLKKFVLSTNETFQESLNQCIFDYINILSHVCGNNSNTELTRIMNSFEIDAQVIFKKMKQSRQGFLKVRKEESILLGRKLPHSDNGKYIIANISDELYNGIRELIKKYPHVFSNEKKANIKDIINRSILFRVMKNDMLMQNNIYREWRLSVVMKRESSGKIDIEDIFDIVSKKRKVTWKSQLPND